MKFCRKKLKILHFFEKLIFAVLWASRKWKKSNHQKCENLIKRPYFFIAAFERRVLNTIFGPPEPSRKNFSSGHREVNLPNFSFFAKKHGKINAFLIFENSDLQNLQFFIGFSKKWLGTFFEFPFFAKKNMNNVAKSEIKCAKELLLIESKALKNQIFWKL